VTSEEFDTYFRDPERRKATKQHLIEGFSWVPPEMIHDEGIHALVEERTRDFCLELIGVDVVATEFNRLITEKS
jgi:hypothetical protein